MRRIVGVLLAVCALAAGPALAAPLARGEFANFDAHTGTGPESRGAVIAESSAPYEFFDFCCAGESQWRVHGTFESKVVRAADGTLDFFWRAYQETEILRGSGGGVLYWLLNNFFDPSVSYDAGYLQGTGDYHPESAWVIDNPNVPFPLDAVYMPLATERSTPGWTDWFFFDTNARGYDTRASFAAYGPVWTRAGSDAVRAYAPLPVPEPSTWATMLSGVLAMAYLRSRRTKDRR